MELNATHWGGHSTVDFPRIHFHIKIVNRAPTFILFFYPNPVGMSNVDCHSILRHWYISSFSNEN